MSGNNVVSVDLKYEEAALRRQFIHKRSIKNDDIKKTTYGHLSLHCLLYTHRRHIAEQTPLIKIFDDEHGQLPVLAAFGPEQ